MGKYFPVLAWKVAMIKPADESGNAKVPYLHRLSAPFLERVKAVALMVHLSQAGWQESLNEALDLEFPLDAEMRTFAEASFSEIVGHLIKGKTEILIRRSLSHGLELVVV